MGQLVKFMDTLPPLSAKKSPGLACLLGMLFGGIALGLYFWSLVDFVIPIGLAIVASLILGPIGFLGGVITAGLWGFFRAVNSNDRLDGKTIGR